MALDPIRPKDLAAATLVTATGTMIPGDNGATVERVTPSQIVAAVAPVASQATAIAGVNNTERMTPLTTRQVLDDEMAPSVALAQAWAESAAAPNPLDPTSKSSKTWAYEASLYASAVAAIGSYYDETDLEMDSVIIPIGVEIITRIPDGSSLDQVAVPAELSWWKRTTPPTSQPYFTTSGGVVWTQVGYRESEVLSTVHSALQGAYGSVRNFATRADALVWIALNPAPAVGSILSAAGHRYRFIGYITTQIADMAGYVPDSTPTPEHHGWLSAQSSADQTLAMQAALQAGYGEVLFSAGQTYTVDYCYALITAPIHLRINGTIKGSNSASFLTSVVMRIDGGVSTRYSVHVTMTGRFDGSLRTNTAGVSSGSGLCIRYTDYSHIDGGGVFYAGESKTSGFGDSGLVPEYCRKMVVDGVSFRGWNDHGIYATAGATGVTAAYATDLTVTNCHFSEIGGGDIRFARDYHRLKVINNTSVDSGKLLIVSGGTSNFVSGDQIIVSGNSVDNCSFSAIDIRYTQSESGSIICNNQIYDWAMTTAAPAINVRGASNVIVSGNIIKPRAFAQGTSATSCTTGVYITDATGDDGAAYTARNVSVYGNQIEVFDRSAEAGPPANNGCIRDQTSLANIYDNDLGNAYPFDIHAGGGSDASIGSALVRRKTALGVGFGGIIPVSNLNTADDFSVIRGDTSTRSVLVDAGSTTLHRVVSYSPSTSARQFAINATTDAANTAPSGGAVALLLQVLGLTKLTATDASVALSTVLGAWSRTVAQANAIPATAGGMLYISNESGGAVPAFGDGTNWRRVTDRAVIS